LSVQEVEHWMDPGADEAYLLQPNSECLHICPGGSRRAIMFCGERERTQTIC
jgi:hypothetical protein